MSQKIIDRATEVIANNINSGNAYCVLSLIDLEGFPTSSVITPSKACGINWLTFCTGLRSDKAARIAKCNKASVCFGTEEHNITLVGTIEVLTDSATKKEMWYNGLENHFSGSDDPNYCVLKFTTKRYNLLVDWEETAGVL